jgi:hypothetical protein
VTKKLANAMKTTRDELHEFIDEIDVDLARPRLHATIDTLPDAIVPDVLNRMRALRARTTVLLPELHSRA